MYARKLVKNSGRDNRKAEWQIPCYIYLTYVKSNLLEMGYQYLFLWVVRISSKSKTMFLWSVFLVSHVVILTLILMLYNYCITKLT